MKIIKNGLVRLLALGLAGCGGMDRSVNFGDYAMSRETFDFISNYVHEQGYCPMDYEGLMFDFCKSDRNKDNYVTKEEIEYSIWESIIIGKARSGS